MMFVELLRHVACRAFPRAWLNTGNKMAARIAMMAITTSNSIKVKPTRGLLAVTSLSLKHRHRPCISLPSFCPSKKGVVLRRFHFSTLFFLASIPSSDAFTLVRPFSGVNTLKALFSL
jgi:hypothetical protein